MSDQPRWLYYLVTYDTPNGPRETACASLWQAWETVDRFTGGTGKVFGVRRRAEVRPGETPHEQVPVDREGRAV